jgi:hypothetical protein
MTQMKVNKSILCLLNISLILTPNTRISAQDNTLTQSRVSPTVLTTTSSTVEDENFEDTTNKDDLPTISEDDNILGEIDNVPEINEDESVDLPEISEDNNSDDIIEDIPDISEDNESEDIIEDIPEISDEDDTLIDDEDNTLVDEEDDSSENEEEEITTLSESTIISLDLPTNINFIIDPYNTLNSGDIISDAFNITNYSNVSVNISVSNFKVSIPEYSEVVYKDFLTGDETDKSLTFYLYNCESNKSFNLSSNTASINLDSLAPSQAQLYQLKGKVNSNNSSWNKNDKIDFTFTVTVDQN